MALEILRETVGDGTRSVVYGVRKVKPAAPPAPPPEPAKPEFGAHQLHPSEDAITVRATAHGGDREAARSQLVGEVREQLQKLDRVQPDLNTDIRAGLRDTEAQRLHWLEALATGTDAGNNAAGLLAERAGVRKEIADVRAEQAKAQSVLDAPESVTMDGAALAVAMQKVKHLPARVAELASKEAALTGKVHDVAAKAGLDLARVLAVMTEDAGPDPAHNRGPRNSDVWRLLQSGFLTAD